MSDLQVLVDETNDERINNTIKQGVLAFNQPYFGVQEAKPFTIYIIDDNKSILCGLYGCHFDKYIRVDMTWVDESYRKKGFGKKLFQKLDEYARQKHCKYIQLDTFDFQAKPFYEKMGFECIGTIPKWVEGYDCHFMRKTL